MMTQFTAVSMEEKYIFLFPLAWFRQISRGMSGNKTKKKESDSIHCLHPGLVTMTTSEAPSRETIRQNLFFFLVCVQRTTHLWKKWLSVPYDEHNMKRQSVKWSSTETNVILRSDASESMTQLVFKTVWVKLCVCAWVFINVADAHRQSHKSNCTVSSRLTACPGNGSWSSAQSLFKTVSVDAQKSAGELWARGRSGGGWK